MYGGRAPDERTAKIWTAGTGSKGSTESAFELVYSGERVSLHKDGKVGCDTGCGTATKYFFGGSMFAFESSSTVAVARF